MTPNDYLEAEGATVEQAIQRALTALGAEEADVSIEILSTPRSGLLGLGARPARIRVRRRVPEGARSEVASPPPAEQRKEAATQPPAAEPAPEQTRPQSRIEPQKAETEPQAEAEPEGVETPADGGPERLSASLDEQCQEALRLVTGILDLMGEQAETALVSSAPDGISIDIKGDGSGILIGRHGQTLDALEYLVNRLLSRRIKDAAPVSLDIAAYRSRRYQQLERMALSMGERAKREHKTVALEPMPPRDRRIVHLALKDDPLLTTRSVGIGYMRALEIVPTDMARDRSQRNRPSRTPGQQGGFKHGQKRIV